MAYAVWPLSLPQLIDQRGYSGSSPDNVIVTPMDVGPSKSRRRHTKRGFTYVSRVVLNSSQYATFRTFWNVTISDGALPFEYKRADGTTVNVVARPPQYSEQGDGPYMVVSMSLEELVS